MEIKGNEYRYCLIDVMDFLNKFFEVVQTCEKWL